MVHHLDMGKIVANIVVDIILCGNILVLHFLPIVLGSCLQKLYLPDAGPQSFAFDSEGEGPYTGVADGRVLKYEGPTTGFVEFAYTNPNRSAEFCDGSNNTYLARTCGRPLGLGFYNKTGELYVVDTVRGLLVVGPQGGLAKQLVGSVEGVPLNSPDALEVDQETGIVYFTEASAVYNFSQIAEFSASNDSTGRVFKYDPKTNNVTVLVRGLSGAAGIAISKDGSFLLLTEFVTFRIQKYWLKGPLANTTQVLLNLTGAPDRIKRNSEGDFWISLTVQTQGATPGVELQGQKINGNGDILETLSFSPEFNSSVITEVHEFQSALYLGSLYTDYVGEYRCPYTGRDVI